MKFAYSLLLLSLPSVFSFVPSASVARIRTTKQELNLFGFGKKRKEQSLIPEDEEDKKNEGGFTSSLMEDVEDDETVAKEQKKLLKKFAKKKAIDVSTDKLLTPDEFLANDKDGIFRYKPTKEMTGVEPEMAQLCATISNQLYSKSSFKDFKLSTAENKCELFIYDNHGDFFHATPPFCVAITGKTMILGWRGTSGLMDGLTDAAASPQSNIAWRKHAKTIKAQGPMTSVVLNDIATHEKAIIKKAKELGITEIITTGQSLGGGASQIGHLVVRAQIEDEVSPWHALEGVNVRSVAFCGPMTTVLVDNATSETDKFVEKLSQNSCNFVFMNDVVPRGYACLEFVEDFTDNATGDLASVIKTNRAVRFLAKNVFHVRNKVDNIIDDIAKGEALEGIFEVLFQYRHIGNLVYYESEDAEPRVVVDMGSFYKNPKKRTDIFRSIEYKNVDHAIDEFMYWHMHIIRGPGLAYPEEDLS